MKDRDVVVTGGAGALGTAVVDALLKAGARCYIPTRRAPAHSRQDPRDQVVWVPDCDLTKEEDTERLYAQVPDLWGSLHIAGGFEMGKLADTTHDDLMHMLNINFVTCFLCSKAAVRRFGDSGGRIVNVASRPALEPRAGSGAIAYAASKAAVSALTQALAAEVASRSILVNAVAPSTINTAANRQAMPNANFDAWPTPEQIAQTIVFLASPQNQATSGAVLPIFGR